LGWAAGPAIATSGRRSHPHTLAVVDTKREHSAAACGIDIYLLMSFEPGSRDLEKPISERAT
jgi:hypothetical protein